MMPDSTSATGPGPARPSRRFRPGRRRWDHDEEIRVLKGLWERQAAGGAFRDVAGADFDYVAAHFAMDLTLRRKLRVLDQICVHLRGRVLEWGCQHALDSCVYRMRFGDALELHGCDLFPSGTYRAFHGFAGLAYARLGHHVDTGYPDESFDVVTSNGVLEHVHDDAASAREVRRILRPGGTFAVTCLPNRWSYTEAMQRALGHTAHDRLYTIASARALLESAGFEVLDAGFAFLLPTMLYGFPAWLRSAYQRLDRPMHAANALLERAWPIDRLASNLWLIARRAPGRDDPPGPRTR